MFSKKILISVLIFFSAIIILQSCWFKSSVCNAPLNVDNGAGQQKSFRGPLGMNPYTLDPAKLGDEPYAKQQIFTQVFEGLVRYNADNKLESALARKWDISKNGKVYKFYLRDDVYFHNGCKVTANDVKWSIERACNPKIASPTAESAFSNILGADDVLRGKSTTIVGIEIPSPSIVRFHLKKPISYFLDLLTMPVASVLSKKSTRFNKGINSIDEMVGIGPFKMHDYIPGQHIILNPFEKYMDGAPKFRSVVWHIASDPIMNINKFREGNYSWANVPIKEMPRVKVDPILKSSYRVAPTALLIHLQFSPEAYEPFKNPLVRKAVSLAINRKHIVDEILKNTGVEVANSFIPSNYQMNNNPHAILNQDIKKAKLLLQQAGYDDIKKMPPLEVLLPDNSLTGVTVAENICLQLRATLGLNITTKVQEYTAYLKSRIKNQVAIHLHGTYASYIDPSVYLSAFHSKNGKEKSALNSLEFDSIIDKAAEEFNLSKRLKLYQKAESILFNNPPAIPLYYSNVGYLLKYNVSGYERNLLGATSYKNIEIK